MLKHKIINLIQEKREGSYWDFKAEYHKDKAELLHDIICLSNNLLNQEAYLILGVADNGHILGLQVIQIEKPRRINIIYYWKNLLRVGTPRFH